MRCRAFARIARYADRLVQVDELDPISAPLPVATYSYDPLGRRIGKRVFGAGGLPPTVTTYVYDDTKDEDCDGRSDDDVLEVYKGAAVSSVSLLAGGGGGGAAAASYAATGRMLSSPVAFLNGAGEMLFTQCDERGNMLALTDAAGHVVERYDSGDFGAPLFFDAAGAPRVRSSVSNDVLFAGMRWDEETELFHRQAGVNPLYNQSGNAGNNPLNESVSCTGGGSPSYDPMTGRALSRSKGTVKFFNDAKGFGRIGGGSGTRAQDHNSTRSNKTASRVAPGGSGGGRTRGQDHNSTRSNKTASRAAPDGGGGGGTGYTPVNLINPIAMDKGLRF